MFESTNAWTQCLLGSSIHTWPLSKTLGFVCLRDLISGERLERNFFSIKQWFGAISKVLNLRKNVFLPTALVTAEDLIIKWPHNEDVLKVIICSNQPILPLGKNLQTTYQWLHRLRKLTSEHLPFQENKNLFYYDMQYVFEGATYFLEFLRWHSKTAFETMCFYRLRVFIDQ